MASSPQKPSEQESADELAAIVEKALDKDEIEWDLVLNVSMLRALNPELFPAQRAVAERYYFRVVDTFRRCKGGAEVAMFPPIGGVYLLENGEFEWSFDNSKIHFDWSEAWQLVYQIELLAEEAREWWPPNPASEQRGRRLTAGFASLLKSPSLDPHKQDRRPHSSRAFGLATWVMGAIKRGEFGTSRIPGGGAVGAEPGIQRQPCQLSQ